MKAWIRRKLDMKMNCGTRIFPTRKNWANSFEIEESSESNACIKNNVWIYYLIGRLIWNGRRGNQNNEKRFCLNVDERLQFSTASKGDSPLTYEAKMRDEKILSRSSRDRESHYDWMIVICIRRRKKLDKGWINRRKRCGEIIMPDSALFHIRVSDSIAWKRKRMLQTSLVVDFSRESLNMSVTKCFFSSKWNVSRLHLLSPRSSIQKESE